MNKIIVSSLVALVALSANVAAAQSYYPSYGNTAVYTGVCVNLMNDLSWGMRGAEVRQLQTFLVGQNYAGGGNWMITGYFGSATTQAVRNFQQSQGLATTGAVDSATRAAISRVSCGGGYNNIYPYNYTTPYVNPFTTPYTPPTPTTNVCTYPYNQSYAYGYNYCPPAPVTPSLTYLNPNSGAVGATVTVYGSGFSTTGNTVRFGNGIITNIGSGDGHTMTFTVPSQLVGYGTQVMTLGTYNVSVSNSQGYTSNSLPFTVTSLGSYGAPTITSLNGPTTLATGVQGTWTITVNNPSNLYLTTSVNWGDAGQNYANSALSQVTYVQGTNTLTFTHTYYTVGTYTVTFTVSNGSGQQNTTSATVVVTGGIVGSITLSSISPTSGHVGTQIVLQGSGFSSYDNVVHFGIGGMRNVQSYSGNIIVYTIPYAVSPCDLVGPGCAAPSMLVTPGSYPIYVTNSQGTTNTLTFQVL
ncbi:MAG: peptidoglycan-binding protein [bacterium]|nr:peptidoglycan-binding protein [bacterium]